MAVESDFFNRDRQGPGPIDDEDPTIDLVEPGHDTHDIGRSAPADEDSFVPGSTLCGRYVLERVVGRGGSCTVLRALDLHRQVAGNAGAHVAIKVLRPEQRGSAEAVRRFTSEFRQLQQLSHPNIIRVFDLDRHGDDWFQVMELLDGVSLAGLLKHLEGGRLSRERALGILAPCAEALSWAHEQGVVHGDVKPGNIFVTASGGIRLLDFGVDPTDHADADATPSSGSRFATPAYASPQVLSGLPPERRDDIYSLACVARELLTGVHPAAEVEAAVSGAGGAEHPDLDGSDSGSRKALAAGLAPDRELRPATAREFIRLLTAGDDTAVVAHPAVTLDLDVPGWAKPTARASWVGPAIALAALLGLAAMFLGSEQRTPAGSGGTVDAPPATPAKPGSLEPEPMPADNAIPADTTAKSPDSGQLESAVVEPGESVEPVADPVPPPVLQHVGFTRSSLLVSRRAPTVAVPLRRSGSLDGRARVSWKIAEGTARHGRDFRGPTSGAIVLADGQAASTLFIPLLPAPDATADRTFSVSIRSVGDPARKGPITKVDVTIRSFGPAEG